MENTSDTTKELVLIVEDTVDNYEVIETFLKDINVACDIATDGSDAIALVNSQDNDYYALILMDINLPCLNGLDATKRIREMGITVPIIAITASNVDYTSAHYKSIFDATLQKPFTYTEFYTTISPYINAAMAFTQSTMSTLKNTSIKQPTDKNVCDVDRGIQNMGNNPRLFNKHFQSFKNHNVDLGVRLQTLVDEGRYDDASLLCHSVKGTSGMLALTDLSQHIIDLESRLSIPVESATQDKHEIYYLLSAIRDDIFLICQMRF